MAAGGIVVYVIFFPPNMFSKIMSIIVTIFGVIGARLRISKLEQYF